MQSDMASLDSPWANNGASQSIVVPVYGRKDGSEREGEKERENGKKKRREIEVDEDREKRKM